ncbi:type 4 pilus major pilin [Paraburkholderia azotifigens]|uniref:type 4 pilus major pilin n=1 Tax=Paraburkholderia azotifigens TaxID=2057004 RepID=UPI00317C3D00
MTKPARLRLLKMGRRRKQSGELSLIEAGAYMAGAALLAIAVIKGGAYVYTLIKSSQFTSEAQMFHTGMLNATQNDADFSTETLTTLATNRAFDAAGARLASDKSSLKGIFNQPVTISVGTLSTANDSLIMSYQVPAAVCSLSVAALTNTFSQVGANGTTLAGPTTTFSSTTAGTACEAGGAYATLQLYTSRT